MPKAGIFLNSVSSDHVAFKDLREHGVKKSFTMQLLIVSIEVLVEIGNRRVDGLALRRILCL